MAKRSKKPARRGRSREQIHGCVRAVKLGKTLAIEYIRADDGQHYRHDFRGSRAGLYATVEGDALIIRPVRFDSRGFIKD